MLDLEAETFEDVVCGEVFSVVCESRRCENDGLLVHDADVMVRYGCGCVVVWCYRRLRIYWDQREQGFSIRCSKCGEEWRDLISWVPLNIS